MWDAYEKVQQWLDVCGVYNELEDDDTELTNEEIYQTEDTCQGIREAISKHILSMKGRLPL